MARISDVHNKENLIEVENVSFKYNKPTERVDTLKEFFVKLFKGKLRYNAFWVLNDISFEVKKGESLALIGLNGSGKSSLLKTIAGVLEATEGEIRLGGTIAPLLNLGAGFDMESTAKENVFLNGAILGYSRKQMKEKYDSIVEFAELEDSMNVPIKNFSSGMLSRLGFAIAVDVKPDILLVDEILSVGDINFRQKCHKKIEELLKGGTTLIYVSHNMPEVKKLCHKALWIKDNKMQMYGDCSQVVDEYLKYCKEVSENGKKKPAELIETKNEEEKEKKVVPIVLATDHNYAKYAAVTIQSIYENRTQAENVLYKVFIFHDEEILPSDLELFEGMSKDNLSVECVNVGNLISKEMLYSRAHYSNQMFYRWLIPEVLYQYDKVIYLDCDLVVTGDIKELLEIELVENEIIAGVRDTIEKDRIKYYIRKELKVEPEGYINSGVLLIDTKKFFHQDIKEKCLKLLRNHSVLMCPDQDALNIVLKNNIKLLSEKWNLQWGNIDLFDENLDKKIGSVIHYTTEVKPWKPKGANLPLAEYFWKYAQNSPVNDEIIKENPKTEVKKTKKPKKKRNKFLRFFTFPFRLLRKFFRSWRDVGFKNALHEIKCEIGYVFYRIKNKK